MKGPTEGDILKAVSLLRDHPSGVTLPMLRQTFGSHQRGVMVLEALQDRGRAAVVRTKASWMTDEVYKIAESDAEVGDELVAIQSAIDALSRRRDGLLAAYKGGGVPQEGLF